MSNELKPYILQRQIHGRRLLGLSEDNFTNYENDYIERILRRVPKSERAKIKREFDGLDPATNLQSVPPLYSLRNTYDRIDRCANAIGLGIPKRPILATAYGDEIGGEVLFSPPFDYAILMDETYQAYSIIVAKILANGFQPTDRTTNEPLFTDDVTLVKERISRNPLTQSMFDECIFRYLSDGTPTTVGYQPPPDDDFTVSLIDHISSGITTSMVGHEYGHIARDHFKDRDLREICSSNNLLSIDPKSKLPHHRVRQMLEIQADVFSFEICINLAKHEFILQLYVLGILSYLYMKDLLDLFIMVRVRGTNELLQYVIEPFEAQFVEVFDPAAHPSGTIRAGMLIERLKTSGIRPGLLRVIQLIDRTTKTFFSILWNGLLANLDPSSLENVPISSRWQRRVSGLRSTLIVPSDATLEHNF